MSNNSLRHDWIKLCSRNRDGSHATQAARRAILKQAANQLQRELGFRNLRANGIAQRHIAALVRHWQTEKLTAGTIKNRVAHLRWAAEKVAKFGVAGITNEQLGIEKRQYVAKESKAISLSEAQMDKITDPHIQLSLRLQEQFGLRREESLKLIVNQAWQGDRLILQASWTKGGRPRELEVRMPEQRELLNQVRALTGKGSLIPAQRSYIQHLKIYERQLSTARISRAHGLRHAYAQARYQELTGRLAPVLLHMQLNDANINCKTVMTGKLSDADARQLISSELGHERVQITTIYLGR